MHHKPLMSACRREIRVGGFHPEGLPRTPTPQKQPSPLGILAQTKDAGAMLLHTGV